jgi:RHS repeat-associated protein
VVSYSDYYPFGAPMTERTAVVTPTDVRYGFNGKEMDGEIAGNGNAYDFGARMYDSRLGRWWSVDPLVNKYPGLSPYVFSANIPITLADIDGKDFRIKIESNESGTGGKITLESTIFLYGPDASDQLAAAANESFKSKNSVYNYIDAEGKVWEVTMSVTFTYAPLMNGEGKLDDSDERGVTNELNLADFQNSDFDGPSKLDLLGYQEGDNFQYVNKDLPHGEVIGDLTKLGGSYGTTYSPVGPIILHAALHSMGFGDERFGGGIMGITLGKIVEDQFLAIGKFVDQRMFTPDANLSKVESFSNESIDGTFKPEDRQEIREEQSERLLKK